MGKGFLTNLYIKDFRKLLIENHFELKEISKDGYYLTFIKKLKPNETLVKTYDIIGLSVEVFPSGRVIMNLLYANPDIQYIVNQMTSEQTIVRDKILLMDHCTVHCGTVGDKRTMRCILWSCFHDIELGKIKTFPEWLRLNYNEIPDSVNKELSLMVNMTTNDYIQFIIDTINNINGTNIDIQYDEIHDVDSTTYSHSSVKSDEAKIIQFPSMCEDDT